MTIKILGMMVKKYGMAFKVRITTEWTLFRLDIYTLKLVRLDID